MGANTQSEGCGLRSNWQGMNKKQVINFAKARLEEITGSKKGVTDAFKVPPASESEPIVRHAEHSAREGVCESRG